MCACARQIAVLTRLTLIASALCSGQSRPTGSLWTMQRPSRLRSLICLPSTRKSANSLAWTSPPWLARRAAEMLAGKNIIVGITGGVAAHYLPELIGQLRFRCMAMVYAVMTPAAGRFVSPLTIAAAAGTPVQTEIFADAARDPLAHIHLARLADLVLVAPATYDFIGKVASGIADDPLTLLLAATTAPVWLAPAMHDTMWANPILKRNLETLKA